MKRTIVLGAGPAGLAAAWQLTQSQQDQVLLLESATSPGGLCRSISWQDCTMDLGPHRIYTRLPRIKEFLKAQAGLQLLECERTSRLLLHGNLLEYPPSPGDLWRQLGTVQCVRYGLSLAQGRLIHRRPADNYAEEMIARFGPSLYRDLLAPLAEKVWCLPGTEIDAEAARIRMAGRGGLDLLRGLVSGGKNMALRRFQYPKGGIGRLSQHWAQAVTSAGAQLLTEHHIVELVLGDRSGITVVAEDQTGEQRHFMGDQVISTLPLPDLVEMLQPTAPQKVRSAASQLQFSALRLVYLLFPVQPVTNCTWIYFPDRTLNFSRCYEQWYCDPECLPAGQSVVCVEVPCRPGDALWQMSAKQLSSNITQQWLRVMPGTAPIDALVIDVKQAYPVLRKGYQQALECVFDYLRSIPILRTTGRGGLFQYNNLDHSLQTGLDAAQLLMQAPTDSGCWYDWMQRYQDFAIID